MNKRLAKLETVLAGLIYVGLGTIIAAKVDAQSKTPLTTPTKAAQPAIPATTQPATPACETNKSPEAMCSAPLKKGPEAKICFSLKHSRCFEIKDGHLIQTVNDMQGSDKTLNAKEVAEAKTAIKNYQAWLDTELAKYTKSISICRDMVSVDSQTEHKEYCTSKLPRADVQAKTRDLFKTLDSPLGAKGSR